MSWKRINGLEKKVLSDLPEPSTTKITWANGDCDLDRAESKLYELAQQITEKKIEVIREMENYLSKGVEPDPDLDPTFAPQEQKIVDKAHKRFINRVLEVIRAFGEAFVFHSDEMGEYVFFSRFYWIMEETRKQMENMKMEDELYNSS